MFTVITLDGCSRYVISPFGRNDKVNQIYFRNLICFACSLCSGLPLVEMTSKSNLLSLSDLLHLFTVALVTYRRNDKVGIKNKGETIRHPLFKMMIEEFEFWIKTTN